MTEKQWHRLLELREKSSWTRKEWFEASRLEQLLIKSQKGGEICGKTQ